MRPAGDRSVEDNAAEGRFEMAVGDALAFIAYRREGGSVALLHTEVPETLEGQGIGSALVRGTLDRLRAEGKNVVPLCSFVVRFVERHPEYGDMIVGR
ncbi:GNAT family N-acetyltransferase [Belnapia rosea]|uniref:N-acetyltransferase domain-containing protein n=1 Tax=Belnapia rosea TaxID=938405 RepID=A0A1G6JC27_9PROT|nr:GNAT family N-acetyltransferase [Belnapia rosea]SDC16344.1 hypothetical protein SAMN04487779_1001128 [Belnapia rosea]